MSRFKKKSQTLGTLSNKIIHSVTWQNAFTHLAHSFHKSYQFPFRYLQQALSPLIQFQEPLRLGTAELAPLHNRYFLHTTYEGLTSHPHFGR
mgnify:CR=1 FL=1